MQVHTAGLQTDTRMEYLINKRTVLELKDRMDTRV